MMQSKDKHNTLSFIMAIIAVDSSLAVADTTFNLFAYSTSGALSAASLFYHNGT